MRTSRLDLGAEGLRMTIVIWVVLGVLVLAVMSLAWLLVQVLRQQGRLLLRIEALETTGAPETAASDPARGGLPLATAFPPFRLPDLRGQEVGLEDFEVFLGERQIALGALEGVV